MNPRRRAKRGSDGSGSVPAAEAWLLAKPDLEAMRARFPDEWQTVERELAEALAARSTDRLDRLLLRDADAYAKAAGVSKRERWTRRERIGRLVRRRMTILALERHARSLAKATDAGTGRNRLSNALTNGLFFDADGRKKPASLRVFRWFWPLVRSKGEFLTSMQAKGTYCFLSVEFVDEVAKLCRDRSCLEIAAGDGTLSRFLRGRGIPIVATDDGSWIAAASDRSDVVVADARTALAAHCPEVVICSWPPPGNTFEKAVFATKSVRTYLVIGSLHQFATGARPAYEAQDGFRISRRPDLERLVLPPEAGTEVLLFERIAED